MPAEPLLTGPLDRKKFENRNREARPLSEKGRRIARQAENKKNPPQLRQAAVPLSARLAGLEYP
jgi:uncharacterized membrane protein YeaQ/YmgE (transglycosylase-associated protein family)